MRPPARLPAGIAVDGRPVRTEPIGQWLLARIPLGRTYPCRCNLGKRCGTNPAFGCPCMGRVDALDKMPAHCCAKRAAETTVRNAA